MIVCPTLTCPSPAMMTCPSWRTHRIVVCRISAPGSKPLSNPWKGTSINLFQMIHAHMSVPLRCRQARMAEHLLYRPQVRAIAKHMRCETVTQPVRRDSRAQTHSRQSPLQDHLDAARGQSAAAKICNHGTVGLPRNRHRTPPRPQRIQRRLAERHQPILVALARPHHHHHELFVDIAPVQPDQFAHAQPRRGHRLEYGAIAHRGRRRVVRRQRKFDQPANFVRLQYRRQAPFVFRRANRPRRACLAQRRLAVAEKRLDRAQSALNGGAGGFVFHQFGQVAADMIRRDARDFDFIDSSADHRRSLEHETSKRKQIATIARHRIVRGTRRLLQRRRKSLYLRLHCLARTYLSGYAISGDSAEKACLSQRVPQGTNAFELWKSRGALCRAKNSPLRYELLELRKKNRSHRRDGSCWFSRRMSRMRPRAALMPQLRLLRSGIQQQLPSAHGRARGGQGAI